jgi:hypothetical protein
VILTGWKEISKHLGYGIRTLQRWEQQGLPIRRVSNGPRSPVVADSERLEAWILHRTDPKRDGASDNFQRALESHRENRRSFQQRVETFRKEVEDFRAKRLKA